jgi:3-hydroxybutyrate dehydrogenase
VYATIGALGPIDVLVNNAGVGWKTPVDGPRDQVDETFSRVIDINLNGHFYVTRAALPAMGAGGRIILTASVWGKAAGAEYAAYCASKHGILGLMRSLAHELGPRGITVNAVCPGTIRTELNEKHITKEARDLILASMVINRGWIEPDELANLYVFLATPAAKDITGQAYNYDRGQVMA